MSDIDYKFESHKDELLQELSNKIEQALEAMGLIAESYAKLLCPVDTGRLRNSISHDVRDDEEAVYIGTNVEYASYVELGTSNQKEQPYLRPAITDHIDEYRHIAESILK